VPCSYFFLGCVRCFYDIVRKHTRMDAIPITLLLTKSTMANKQPRTKPLHRSAHEPRALTATARCAGQHVPRIPAARTAAVAFINPP